MHRGRSTSAWRARTRPWCATTVSDTRVARSPRCHRGRRAPAGGCRARRPSRLRPRVGLADVERLDECRVTERPGSLQQEERIGQVTWVVVARNVGTRRLEDAAVANRAVADERLAGDVELLRTADG